MVSTLAEPTIAARRDHAGPRDATAATVLLIDARPLLRECLARAIRAEWPEIRLAQAGWDGLDRLAPAPVDLCLVSLTGGGALEQVRAAFPAAALVVLSDQDGYGPVARAAGLGARGFFSTATELAVLVQGIRLVLMGGTAMPLPVTPPAPSPEARSAPAAHSRFSAELFTPKELEVLRSLATGRQNKLIAYELGICETTVKVHLRHIFRKLGTSNRTHAALLAREMLEEVG